MWSQAAEFGQAVMKAYKSSWDVIHEEIDETLEQKEKWGGSMARCGPPTVLQEVDMPMGKLDVSQAVTAATAVSCKMNKRRLGPAQIPLPGVGAFFVGLGAPLYVVGYNMSKIISNGVAIQDVDAFLDTKSGLELVNSGYAVIGQIGEGDTLWMPWGWLPAVFYLHTEKAGRPSKGKAPPWTYCLHIPGVMKELHEGMESAVLTAIRKYSQDVYLANQKVELFKELAAWLNSLE